LEEDVGTVDSCTANKKQKCEGANLLSRKEKKLEEKKNLKK
jgi:hypothetical protein